MVLRCAAALVVALLTALSSAPSSRGVQSTATVAVPVTVAPSIAMSMDACLDPTVGAVLRGSFTSSATDCSVSFDTNNPSGAYLAVAVADTGMPAGLRDISGNSIPPVPGTDLAMSEGRYGMCLREVAGTASGTVAVSALCAPGDAAWFGPAATSLVVAGSSGAGAGAARFRFGVWASRSTAPAAYRTTLTFTVGVR